MRSRKPAARKVLGALGVLQLTVLSSFEECEKSSCTQTTICRWYPSRHPLLLMLGHGLAPTHHHCHLTIGAFITLRYLKCCRLERPHFRDRVQPSTEQAYLSRPDCPSQPIQETKTDFGPNRKLRGGPFPPFRLSVSPLIATASAFHRIRSFEPAAALLSSVQEEKRSKLRKYATLG